jgi:hypothetical protein
MRLTATRRFLNDRRRLQESMTAFVHGCFALAGKSERRGSGAGAMAGYSIFIAHAPADAQTAEEVTQALAETGATVIYGADTSPTPVWRCSHASIASPWIRAVTRKYHEQRQTDRCGSCCPSCWSHFPANVREILSPVDRLRYARAPVDFWLCLR